MKTKDLSSSTVERGAFFPILKEKEFIVVDNSDFKMGKLIFKYEDKFNNHYKQIFEFDKSEIGNSERIMRVSRSCYI